MTSAHFQYQEYHRHERTNTRTPGMTLSSSFPAAEAVAKMRTFANKFVRVTVLLRYGCLVVHISRVKQLLLALQNSTVYLDEFDSRTITIRFKSGPRSSIVLRFSSQCAGELWNRLLSECSKWQLEDFYTLDKQIGCGASSVVTSAQSRTDDAHVAIKTIPNKGSRVDHELDIMRYIAHPNVIKAVDVLQTERFTYLVLPLMDGDLTTKVIKAGTRDENTIRAIMYQILSGLVELHESCVIHRDLKPDNIFVSIDNGVVTCKIADFGLSTRIESHELLVADGLIYGTPVYCSPEIRKRNPYGTKSDMFSAGCVMFELITGKHPFEDSGGFQIVDSPEWNAAKDKSSGRLVKRMLDINQDRRISASQALKHGWFEEKL